MGECCPGSQVSFVVCEIVRAKSVGRLPGDHTDKALYVVGAGHEAGVLKVTVVLSRTIRVTGTN